MCNSDLFRYQCAIFREHGVAGLKQFANAKILFTRFRKLGLHPLWTEIRTGDQTYSVTKQKLPLAAATINILHCVNRICFVKNVYITL